MTFLSSVENGEKQDAPMDSLLNAGPVDSSPYSEVKVQAWLTVNSPHFVLPPSPMGTMEGKLLVALKRNLFKL